MKIESRLPDVGTTIFTVMSKMALDYGAINLSQGFPDFPMDEELIELVRHAMLDGHNQYAPMAGVPVLLDQVAKVAGATYGRTIDGAQEVTVTAGGTEALFSSIAAFVKSGDEVIVFDPCFDSYGPAIRLNGATPIHVALRAPDFRIDWDEVRRTITSRTRMIMINTPHNPTGRIWSEQDMKVMEEIAIRNGLVVLSDEVYERMVFDDSRHESVLRYPGLYQQSIAVFSFGKTFHATGWKIGYTIAPPRLTEEIRRAHQFVTFCVNAPVQHALAAYLKDPEHYVNLGKFYEKKRDFFLDQMKGSSFEPLPSKGSYFQLMSYKSISALPEKEMAEDLLKNHKVASIPVSVFYNTQLNQQLLRFCFAKKEETLASAARILRKF